MCGHKSRRLGWLGHTNYERREITRVLGAGLSGNDGRKGMEGKSAMRSLSLTERDRIRGQQWREGAGDPKSKFPGIWGFESKRRRNYMGNTSLTTWLVMMLCIREKNGFHLRRRVCAGMDRR